MLNKLSLLAIHSLFHGFDLIPGLRTPVPDRFPVSSLKRLTSKHKGLIDIISVTSAGLWCKEVGRLSWLGQEICVWNNEFLPCWLHSENCCVFQWGQDFVLVISVYRSPALSWGRWFLFSLEALVYESWRSGSLSSYISNVYIFLKSFGNA